MLFDNIPAELRQLPQWVCWRYEDHGGPKPTKVPYNPATGYKASHSDPFTWNAYQLCVDAAKAGACHGIGFVLQERDPFAFIDLDETFDDVEAAAKQQRVFEAFDSYSERSPSGKGLHIIVKGAVPSGRKRAHMEVYSNQRFMTMTGDVYVNKPINDCQPLLTQLWEQLGGHAALVTYTGDAEQKMSDQQIVQMAQNAANGDKFNELLYGRWQAMYSSQSEADFALVDILAFYTQNREQIVRLFRASALGQRPKAQRSDYVNYMVNRSFDRMLPPVDFDGALNKVADEIAKQRARIQNPFEVPTLPGVKPNTSAYAISTSAELPRQPAAPRKSYDRPPGLLGDIAAFIYAAAPRPVPEIALAGAIGLLAGITGRAYNVSHTGLNQYVMLLAATGTGKEAIASGIEKLMRAVRVQVPASAEFLGPSDIASPEALLKYMDYASSCFVSLMGEFGLKLKAMSSNNAPPHLIGLRRLFLDLYNKSGEGGVLRPMIYSDKQKNTPDIYGPAFTLMGESTPEKFYEALNENMIAEGLLPRFTMIEYLGDRPPLNESHGSIKPPNELVNMLAQLCGHALTLSKNNTAIHVKCDDRATAIMKQFNVYADSKINNSDREVTRQLWNRAHIKALKLAALVAVGDHPYTPTITEAAANWAINLVVTDTENLLLRFENGTVGVMENSDSKQMDDMSRAIAEYMTKPHEQMDKYGVTMTLHQARVIPYSYLSRRLSASSSFKQDRMGATNAIKKIVQALIERGDVQEVPRNDALTKFKTTARCFIISNPASFKMH